MTRYERAVRRMLDDLNLEGILHRALTHLERSEDEFADVHIKLLNEPLDFARRTKVRLYPEDFPAHYELAYKILSLDLPTKKLKKKKLIRKRRSTYIDMWHDEWGTDDYYF